MPTPRAVRKKKTYTAQCKCGQKFDNYLDAVHHTPDMCTPPRPPEGKLVEQNESKEYILNDEGLKMLRLFPQLVEALEELVNVVDPPGLKTGVQLEDYFIEPVKKARTLLREATK